MKISLFGSGKIAAYKYHPTAYVVTVVLVTKSGVAQWIACWAHNPEVEGSRPSSAILLRAM